MAWIELHQSLPTHRKTLDLADALNIIPAQAVGHVACLWLWALDNAPDGDLSEIKARTLARAAQWDGDPEPFLQALTVAGFLAGGAIHDWQDYTGRLIDARKRNAERVRQWRQQHGTTPTVVTDDARNAHVTRTERVRYETTVPNSTVPNSTVPNSTVPIAPNGALAPDATAPDAPGTALAVRAAPAAAVEPGHRELWDAFTSVFGEARGKTERQRRGEACKRAVEAHAVPEEIRQAAAHWPNVMSDATMTELGIVSNLGKLLTGPQVHGRHNGTVTKHVQSVTESALVTRKESVDDMRTRRRLENTHAPN